MNERQLGHFVKQSLNQALEPDGSVASRLRLAREAALQKQRLTATAPLLAWANTLGTFNAPRTLIPRLLLPAFLLMAGLFAVNYWYQMQQAEETVEIDSAVLLGELPIDAYLDKGFGAWLKSSPEE